MILFVRDMDLQMGRAEDFYREPGNEKKARVFSEQIGLDFAAGKEIFLDLFLFWLFDRGKWPAGWQERAWHIAAATAGARLLSASLNFILNRYWVFGRGKVCTQVVAGVELAAEHSFSDPEEALASNFQACEFFAEHGVQFLVTIWRPHRATRLGCRPMAPLDYYVRLAEGVHAIRKAHGLRNTNDNYKHCGNHPDSDLERLD